MVRGIHHRGDDRAVGVRVALPGSAVLLTPRGCTLKALNYVDNIAQRIKWEVPPDILPGGDTDLLFRMYAVLALVVGEKVEAENVHDAWSAWMSQNDPGHGSIKPFDELSEDVQVQDEPFVKAIRKVAGGLG
jgi:hypothetical protein